jgi:hypothetical protein
MREKTMKISKRLSLPIAVALGLGGRTSVLSPQGLLSPTPFSFFHPVAFSTAQAQSPDWPTNKAFYLRGTFNSWKEAQLFQRVDESTLQTALTLSAGRHEFKISDSGWQNVFSLDPSETRRLTPGESASLVEANGNAANGVIEIRSPGSYVFRVRLIAGERAIVSISYGGPEPRKPLPFEPSVQKEWLGFRSAVRVRDAGNGLKGYEFFSDAPQRDAPTPLVVSFQENEHWPRLRSGNDLMDGLFGLAVHEAELNETQNIRDGAFNRGSNIPCDCFITGEKWGYVWTRDTAYASHLGLGWLDPQRVWRSLQFKVSPLRRGQGFGPEIVQDTGTGGSWPVSTDRVTWALGVAGVLDGLAEGQPKEALRSQAFEALSNTLERDRNAVFDERDGLYKGEQSFLDWREQSYPFWTRQFVTAIAEGKSLSTNAAHYLALTHASRWAAKMGDADRAQRYAQWADRLKTSLREAFLEKSGPQVGQWNALRLGASFPLTLSGRYDLLGMSLASLAGIFSSEEARIAFSKYPLGEAGSPVVWPQSPEVAIYHNRAIWPFVSAYAAQAAARAGHVTFAAGQMESLVRGAALNLSNMENLEFTSGLAQYYDGGFTGPVVNSRRQLWSIGAYLSLFRDTLFGVRLGDNQRVSFSPFVPSVFRNRYFNSSGTVRLENVNILGKKVTLVMKFPQDRTSEPGAVYDSVRSVLVDGVRQESFSLAPEELREGALVDIELGAARKGYSAYRSLEMNNPFEPSALEKAKYLSPNTPVLKVTRQGQRQVSVERDARGSEGTVWDLYRNGKLIAQGQTGASFQDSPPSDVEGQACYVAVQFAKGITNPSHPTPESCVYVGAIKEGVGRASRSPRENLEEFSYEAQYSGTHQITFLYSNSYNEVSTGITAATKRAVVRRERDGQVIAERVITMPHLPRWDMRASSSGMTVNLDKSERYFVRIEDFFNMSYLSHYELYDGAGGRSGPVNTSVVHEALVAPLLTRQP